MRTVEILEGNETIRRIMTTSLEKVGVEVLARAGVEDDPLGLSDLLVVDVDSGLDVMERAAVYLDDERSVLFCGLRDSRARYAEEQWVNRPFTTTAFVAECMGALGLDEDSSPTGAMKPPPDFADPRDEPITRELAYDEAQELERRLGLDAGALVPDPDRERTVSDEDAFEVIDLDDSGVLVVDASLGGKVTGGVNKRRVAAYEIDAQREDDIQIRGVRSRTFNQTMPDTPHALNDSEEVDETRDRRVPVELGLPSTTDSALDQVSAGELAIQIRGVARMLAESWQRIALTSRTEDRADRIERVLSAALRTGMRGAAVEVERIPLASGFSGSLNALTFIDTIRTIRDRQLRGRLEVAVAEEAFVVHMDGLYLEEIDTLSGNVDGMLLEILHQGGALDDRVYEELLDAYESGQFIGPLELELARKKVVADATLQSARVVRAREVFRRLCATRGGQFAFLEIRPGDGQPWPVDSLRVNVDQLMLELLRESSIDTGDSQATASTKLQLDPNRAAALVQSRLTEEERNVMMFFKDGDTLEAARVRLQKQAGPEAVDRIVDRLKKVELLKRSSPEIIVSSILEATHEPEPPPLAVKPVPQRTTVVSPVSDVLSIDEKRQMDTSTEQTTSLAPNWDLIPDTGELDELIDEGITAYESELSEAHEDEDD